MKKKIISTRVIITNPFVHWLKYGENEFIFFVRLLALQAVNHTMISRNSSSVHTTYYRFTIMFISLSRVALYSHRSSQGPVPHLRRAFIYYHQTTTASLWFSSNPEENLFRANPPACQVNRLDGLLFNL